MKKNCLLFLMFAVLSIIPTKHSIAVVAKSLVSPYLFNFNTDGVLRESGDTSLSSSPYWWVNSGGYMMLNEGKGSTVEGSLPATDPWRILYSANNPTDTDNGYHPQNIFRLVSRSRWQNARQEAYFVIKKDNLSTSSNRNQSNGLLLFNRYQNGQSLYYTGVRVDGSAVIKKKLNGAYYTIAEIKGTYPGSYNRSSSPNLLPKNKWIGIRSEVINESATRVRIKLYLDEGWSGAWKLVADVVDDGSRWGRAITESGFVGIRTDFMDVAFENFRVRSI